jgi:hypothetical protein
MTAKAYGKRASAYQDTPPGERIVNRYTGTCYRCHEAVAPGTGTIAKVGRRWLVTHASCRPPVVRRGSYRLQAWRWQQDMAKQPRTLANPYGDKVML